jgi:hypothetical protein
MKLKFLKYFCIAFLIICIAEQLKAQNANAEAEFKAVMEKYNAVGAALAVVKEGKIIYAHSFGLKDLENKKPLTDQDIFRIASISKSFSATSIMQLVEAGKISLNDDFGDLVGFKIRNPKFPDQRITLKMALSHTSSLNDSQGYLNLDVINPDKNPNWAKCYNGYAPGSKFDYCNLNFNMIGAIIEKKSGERFDYYVKNLLTTIGRTYHCRRSVIVQSHKMHHPDSDNKHLASHSIFLSASHGDVNILLLAHRNNLLADQQPLLPLSVRDLEDLILLGRISSLHHILLCSSLRRHRSLLHKHYIF